MAVQQRPIAIPEPVNEVDSLWRTTQALKEAVEVIQGIRGSRTAALSTELQEAVAALQQEINNITVGGGGGLTDVVDDLTPQLGGDLDVQANSINTSTLNGDIDIQPNGTGDVVLGNYTFDGDQSLAGADNYVLTYDSGGGKISLEAATGGGSQTPWTSDIDGAGFGLDNIDRLEIQGAVATDTMTMTVGGVDAFLTFANTQAWVISGLTGAGSTRIQLEDGADIWVQDGGEVGVYSATNSGFVFLNHTGTDARLDANSATTDFTVAGSALATFTVGTMPFDVDQTIGAGQDNYVLTYDHSTTEIRLEAAVGYPTHTGEVTGDVALSLDVSAITNQTELISTTVAPDDEVVISDTSGGTLARADIAALTDAGNF